ncbi:hypothetical protein ACFVMC_00720 [Nocardia sp. NPDC127579]|uniref:hypothetical protein n=1 Tax=Nocardia sp. NPDC127579 TaxID=3345402 RepID=UPI0036264C97
MTFGNFTGTIASLSGRVVDLFSSGISPVQAEKDAQAAGNTDRDRLYAENKALATGFNGEYANTVVPPVIEPFVGMKHSEITAFIESIDLPTMWGSVQSWKDLATNTKSKGDAFYNSTKAKMDSGWSGTAASSALASVQAYLGDVKKVEQASNLIANKLEEAFTGFSQVTYQVPHESEGRSGGMLANIVGSIGDVVGFGGDRISSTDAGRQKNAEDLANEVMRTVYRPVALQADANVPKIPSPATEPAQPNVVIPNPNDNGNGNGNGNGNPNTGQPGETKPASTDPGTTNAPSPSTTPQSTNTPSASTTPQSATPSSSVPQSAVPSSSNVPSSSAPRSNVPSSNVPRSAVPASNTPKTGTPKTVSGVPGTGTPKSSAASNSAKAASAGRSGMPGMGGMPGRGNSNKDEDDEHSSPDYLHGYHEELLGPEKLHVPPVIGGDA